MTTKDINSISTQENVPFMLNLHTGIISNKLDTIHALVTTTKIAQLSLDESEQDNALIKILELIEDIASDFKSVYEVERLLKALE